MDYDIDLPEIETQLTESALTRTPEDDFTEYDSFDATLVYIPDPPKVEVKREHIIESVNQISLDSVHITLSRQNDDEPAKLFYISQEDGITSYSGSSPDMAHAMIDILLCEDWAVLTMDTDKLPTPLTDIITEMTVLPDGTAEEGELFSQLYAINQLKYRIYDLKQSEASLWEENEDHKETA